MVVPDPEGVRLTWAAAITVHKAFSVAFSTCALLCERTDDDGREFSWMRNAKRTDTGTTNLMQLSPPKVSDERCVSRATSPLAK